MRSLIARREHTEPAAGTDESRQATSPGAAAPGYGRPGAPANPAAAPSPAGAAAPAQPAAPGPTVGGRPVEGTARPSWLQPEGGGQEERRTTESTLIVGPNIKLKGEIAACDTLVVEGTIEAAMDSHHIAIAKGGVFSGKVTVDTAEVAGAFDGDLTVRDRLLVRSSGSISGTVRYGALEVEHGGRLSGSLELLSEAEKRNASALSSAAAGGSSAQGSGYRPGGDTKTARPDDGTTTPPHAAQPA
ncbi:polymer-forming cytoskeletal protein [Caenispirillum bisanense]|uniref:bactofilin family protein n=1 Tax=Caenispirillum bisanense TaxID=414052 RepID=UPI0031D79090